MSTYLQTAINNFWNKKFTVATWILTVVRAEFLCLTDMLFIMLVYLIHAYNYRHWQLLAVGGGLDTYCLDIKSKLGWFMSHSVHHLVSSIMWSGQYWVAVLYIWHLQHYLVLLITVYTNLAALLCQLIVILTVWCLDCI